MSQPTPPQGNAKAPINVFWILHRKDGYDLCFKFPRSEEDMKFLCAFDQTKVVEYKYAKELEAEIERLKRLLEVSEEDYSRYIRSSAEKLAVAVADLSKINKIVGAIPFSDQDKWGSTLEIVWGISSKYRDARASIRGQNG